MLGAKDHEDAGRIIGELHAAASTPAAQGIDLHNLLSEMIELHDKRGSVLTVHMERLKELLIDASPKGALNEQFGSAEGLEGPEARDAARWRHARRILPISVIEEGQVMLTEFGGRSSEAENLRADAAIDAAMRGQAGDAEVQP